MGWVPFSKDFGWKPRVRNAKVQARSKDSKSIQYMPLKCAVRLNLKVSSLMVLVPRVNG